MIRVRSGEHFCSELINILICSKSSLKVWLHDTLLIFSLCLLRWSVCGWSEVTWLPNECGLPRITAPGLLLFENWSYNVLLVQSTPNGPHDKKNESRRPCSHFFAFKVHSIYLIVALVSLSFSKEARGQEVPRMHHDPWQTPTCMNSALACHFWLPQPRLWGKVLAFSSGAMASTFTAIGRHPFDRATTWDA